jgi:hypothetical protein
MAETEKKWRVEFEGGEWQVYKGKFLCATVGSPTAANRIATLLNLAEGIPTEELGERVRVTKPVDPNSLTPYPIRVQIGAEFNRRTLGGTAWATSADEIEQISLGLRTYKP